MLQALLFDLDGTIVNSLKLTFDGFNHAFQTFGMPAMTPTEIMQHFGPGEKQIFRRIVGDEVYEQASDEYHRYVRSRMNETPLFDGMKAVLDELHNRGIPMGIVTGRGRASTDYIVGHHGLSGYFRSIITHDEAPASKPSPAGIQKALDEMALTPDGAAYVGDMWSDIRAARRGGCLAVAAMWDPVYDEALITPEAPHVFVKEPPGLIQFMDTAFRDPDLRVKQIRF